MGLLDYVNPYAIQGKVLKKIGDSTGLTGKIRGLTGDLGLSGLTEDSEDTKRLREMQRQQSEAASRFAGEGENAFSAIGSEGAANRQYLHDLAKGRNSVSAEQLRQGMQQQLAAQRSMAASAAPRDQSMAALAAMNNMGRAGYGMSGQQAVAGLQERNDAQRALAESIARARQQELEAALGSRQNANAALGAYKPEGSWMDKNAGAIGGAASVLGMMFSDKRLKKDIKKADGDARTAVDKLRAYSYKYKDEKHGRGKQVGIMAQDLEKAGLGHAVIDTPTGKAVDGAKLSGANTALIAALGRRVAKLEGGRK